MNTRISVIISTYNPNIVLLRRTLDALVVQTMNANNWELVLIDNSSTKPFDLGETMRKFKNARIIREDRLGLAYGRLAGIRNSGGEILVFVDDDNVLAENYLEAANRIFTSAKKLGMAGGVIQPEWCDGKPEAWAHEAVLDFARRDFGKFALIADHSLYRNSLPDFAPIGAGMVARRAALQNWVAQVERTFFTDRRGEELTSCGDTEMVIEAFHAGWSVAYLPELKLTHLIPKHRMQFDYLARAFYQHNKCWVQLLYKYGITGYAPAAPWTLIPRKIRAYLRCRAWAGRRQYLAWRKACGNFDGRAAIYANKIMLKETKRA
jgi:glycosyltransferase involved in cell wall biosynthesis